MAAQIEIAGTLIELEENIKYNFQVNDIAEIADRQATYTNSFKIPRTKEIIELFEGLGIAGDTSGSPYRKVSIRLFDNYVPIVEKGWLQIRQTDERYYNIAVYSGVIDFFKAIENKTTEDIDFSDLDHVKNPTNIIATWQNNLDYRYFIADYTVGANPIYQTDNLDDAWDAGSLQPSFKIAWLWDKIFEKYGFTYSGIIFNTNDFKSRYITYPKSRVEAVTIPAAELSKVDSGPYIVNNPYPSPLPQGQWRPFTEGNAANKYQFFGAGIGPVADGWRVQVLEDGLYQIELNLNVRFQYNKLTGGFEDGGYRFIIWRNNGGIVNRSVSANETVQTTVNAILSAGDVLDFEFRSIQSSQFVVVSFDDFKVDISKADETTGEGDPVLNIGLTDFFKEVLWMFGLTAIPDKYSNKIEFQTLQERVQKAKIVDWSKKYVRRIKEEYVYGYARDNILAHQYTGDNDRSHDGHLYVDNENLEETKTLITSNFYAPSSEIVYRPDGGQFFTLNRYPVVEVEVNDDGTITDNFEERNFLIAGKLKNQQIRIGMRGVPGSDEIADSYYEDDFDITSYNTAVSSYYQELQNILNDTRIHTIELCLSPPDIAELDFRKLYYFDQEANYYLLNKLQYEQGKFAKAEFVRVKLTRVLGEFSDAFNEDFNI